MALRDPMNPKYFPLGRGKCRVCGQARYRQGRCRQHFYENRKREYDEKKKMRIEKPCAHCGLAMVVSRPMQKYCSPKCCDRARLAREQKGPIRENVPCKVCGKPFNQDRSNGSYCSKRCGWASKASGLQYKLRIPKGLIEAQCEQCGAEFKHKMRASDRKARFCSYPCWYKSNSGTNNPLTRDGVFHIPSARVWVDACAYIRERDGGRCTACHAETRSRNHPVDHIIPRRMVHGWGSDPHMIVNLVTLCRACHGRKLHSENKIIKGDVVGFVLGLAAMHYPMHRVEEAFRQYGLPMQMFRDLETAQCS